ncbi:MAG: hypothetical protein MUC65_04585 [Pontiellaceae bacterium]|jgi:hypothetical protein|nr:hypothetical protein [Pontiellaceae bacterium]
MRHYALFILGLILFTAGCSKAPREKAVTIVNAAQVDAVLLERLRAFAERELHVPVRAVERPKLAGKENFQALEKAAKRIKTDADVTLIVLSGFENESKHLILSSSNGIALVNVQALRIDDAEKFARRIERQVMRAAAFCFSLPPTPDPYCVTRNYYSLEDLDSMGRNFSPPWQGRFAEEAEKRGLASTVRVIRPQPVSP